MIHWLEETTSTNDEAKRGAKEGAPHGTVWVSESQTAGRGRQGRVWTSAPGENLLFSVLLRLEGSIANRPLVGLAAGLAVRDAIGLGAQIKWPNDVLVRGKKIAGILAENSDRALVVGIGINVKSAPPDLPATCIAAEGGDIDRTALLDRVLENVLRDAPLVAAQGLAPIHARLSEADGLRGTRVRTDEGIEGIAKGIDREGRLMVGEHRLAYGEVHLV
jgi:BirA family biotin operon repressor/biotin-[acetyl-CoA-carboxylase] ligase